MAPLQLLLPRASALRWRSSWSSWRPHPPQGPAQRTHTRGDLGYRHPVTPAEVAPVNSPTHAQTAHQDQFQPLLFPVKGQIPEYYRSF